MIDDEKWRKVVGKYKISATFIVGVSLLFAERECTASFHAAYW
tara:strand:- start:1 stop:129 length:129 start_codon:yes stop_codon:yes gene_type:complete